MQAEIQGDWLYIYKGRMIREKNPDLTEIGKEDSFSTVIPLRISAITGMEVDNKELTCKIYAQGFQYPILCEFGQRNPYRINCHGLFVATLQKALGLSAEHVWGLDRRSEQTAQSVPRAYDDSCFHSDSD